MTTLPRNTLLAGDAAAVLSRLPASSVDCVITSPPYFQLRDYGVKGQIGLEPTIDAWVSSLRRVFAQVARVLKPSGSLWLNLGDSYSQHPQLGAPVKSLVCAPERLLLALTQDGWLCRNKVIWAKTNPMPVSVVDRLSNTYDVVYFLVRSRRYFFDLDAIREPHKSATLRPRAPSVAPEKTWAGPLASASNHGLARIKSEGRAGHVLGKNPGDVWRIAASHYRGAHFATFPHTLVERPLRATCPEQICTKCGEPWRRAVSVTRSSAPTVAREGFVRRYPTRIEVTRVAGDLAPCPCNADAVPGVVLDPFFGTGTVGQVALANGRDWIGIELNPGYRKMARARLAAAPRSDATRKAA